MKKLTLKRIREISDILVTDSDFVGYLEPTHKIYYSSGKYGCNGWIRQGDKTGTLYGCAGRCSELYVFDTVQYVKEGSYPAIAEFDGVWSIDIENSASQYFFIDDECLGFRERAILTELYKVQFEEQGRVARLFSIIDDTSFCYDMQLDRVCG